MQHATSFFDSVLFEGWKIVRLEQVRKVVATQTRILSQLALGARHFLKSLVNSHHIPSPAISTTVCTETNSVSAVIAQCSNEQQDGT